MSTRAQQVFYLYDVQKQTVVMDDEDVPCLYLDPESAAIAALEKFGKKAMNKGLYMAKPAMARGYTDEEAAQEEEVSFRGTERFSSTESKKLGSGKKR